MKKFMIMYIVLSVIMLVFLYLYTIIQETNSRSFELFYELADEAQTTDNLDKFIKYQSVAYQLVDEIETDDYSFHIYQVVALLDKEYINQFTIFVMPKSEITYAETLDDIADQTSVILMDHSTGDAIYQTTTDSDYDDYAVSYGVKRVGFYYYAVVLGQDYQLDISLKDYNAENILEITLAYTYIDYDENNSGSLILGYTNDEIEDLLDLSSYTQPALLKNIAIYLVVDIIVGAIIHFILKRKII